MIFSGLDDSVAGEIEMLFVKHQFKVFSNAKNYRMNPLVPLIVPTVNHHDFDLVAAQQKSWGTEGFLVCNANCSTTGLVVALKALSHFGLKDVNVVTMQAISGAGYPGVPSLDILGNVVPFISNEESKIETEAKKILSLEDLNISATCNRVAVIDGHMMCVSVKFKSPVDIEKVEAAFCDYSTPFLKTPIHTMAEQDRPQPRLDSMNGLGFAISVGRIRKCNIFDVKFTALVHNTILGAAGSGLINAEIAIEKGHLTK